MLDQAPVNVTVLPTTTKQYISIWQLTIDEFDKLINIDMKRIAYEAGHGFFKGEIVWLVYRILVDQLHANQI